MEVPALVGRRAQPRARAAGLVGAQDRAALLHELDHAVEEGEQPLGRRRAGAERRRAAQDGLLQAPLRLVQQRAQEPLAVAEAPEQRALADARGARDVVHGHRLDAALGEQPGGRLQHAARGCARRPRARPAARRRGGARSRPRDQRSVTGLLVRIMLRFQSDRAVRIACQRRPTWQRSSQTRWSSSRAGAGASAARRPSGSSPRARPSSSAARGPRCWPTRRPRSTRRASARCSYPARCTGAPTRRRSWRRRSSASAASTCS